jgi:hypothetical protein
VLIDDVVGGVWNINANNFLGQLEIEDVEADGTLVKPVLTSPHLAAPEPVVGFFNKDAGELTFLRTPGNDPTAVQLFVGYLAQQGLNGQDEQVQYLAGYVQYFRADGATGEHNRLPWKGDPT